MMHYTQWLSCSFCVDLNRIIGIGHGLVAPSLYNMLYAPNDIVTNAISQYGYV